MPHYRRPFRKEVRERSQGSGFGIPHRSDRRRSMASGHAAKGASEDWLSVWIGLLIFVLSLGVFVGTDILGWGITTAVWTDLGKALAPVSKAYAGLGGIGSLVATYLFLLVVMTIGAAALKADIGKFVTGFTFVFWASYVCWIVGSWAYLAATADKLKAFGISWSLNLTAEAGFLVALIAGLLVGNLFPRLVEATREAIRPEWYIKTAIVFRGLCAIIEAYLVYWAVVYFVSRRYFGLSREWAAPLASGISICGVSAAIATAGAIKARPIVPIMISSLVVVFSCVELLILPFVAQAFLYTEPMVAGGWMGLAVKTDGAAVASGAITDALIRAKALAVQGVRYQEGWMVGTTTTVKVFIDVFIGVWAFILAVIWTSAIERRPGERVSPRQIWDRFPKFVIGYVFTFLVILLVGLAAPGLLGKAKAAMGEANVFRGIFFVMTFFTIGALSNFSKLWEEGLGRLAAIYVVCLFGFIIWVGLLVSWIFFHGVKPPLVAG